MKQSSTVRTRIAPSPTGYLHIGTARTALFNYLYARKQNGAFVLRIEDTDLERSDPKFETELLDSLEWLGIIPDEGPRQGGPYGPYRQTERLGTYRKYLEQLLEENKAFYCFHTEGELDSEKKHQMEYRIPLRHICKDWRQYPLADAQERINKGEKGIIRFKTSYDTRTTAISFVDEIRSQISNFLLLLGDFSLAKSLDAPLYNLAVVIDDYEMRITHIIRGEDHIPNTLKQLLIAEALGWAKENKHGELVAERWTYAHLPLILGSDRSKLSKRHGATAIREFRGQGYLAEALVNFMALLGWNPGSDRELFSLEDLIEEFDLARVQKSGAIFNIEKLDWMNGEYIRKKSPQELTPLIRAHLGETAASDELLAGVIAIEQPRLKKLSEIGERADFFFRAPDYPAELLSWKGMSGEEIASALRRAGELLADIPEQEFTSENLEKQFLEAIGAGDKGALLWPLRVALSGKAASPGPFEIMAVLGRGESLQRIKAAIEKVTKS